MDFPNFVCLFVCIFSGNFYFLFLPFGVCHIPSTAAVKRFMIATATASIFDRRRVLQRKVMKSNKQKIMKNNNTHHHLCNK